MTDEREKVTVHRVEVMVIDHDGIGPGEVQAVLENTHYPNRCISPEVMSIESKVVDWHDQHPLNLRGLTRAAFRKLFGSPRETVQGILRDLTDRRGLRQAWEGIDEDIQEEIVRTWTRIVGGER